MMRRRMAQMNARMNPGGMGALQASPTNPNQPVPSKGGANTSNGPPYNQQPVQQPGKPGMGGMPNKNVQDAVKKVISL